MNIVETLGHLRTLQVFSNTFTKTSNTELVIARNIAGRNINVANGTNTIGKLSAYDQNYSVITDTAVLDHVEVHHGNVYYNTSLTTTNFTNSDFSEIQYETPFPFDSFTNQISGYSDYLRTIPQNGSKRFQSNTYTLSGSEQVNYITFGPTEINNLLTCNTIKFNFNKDALVIINFTGSIPVFFTNIDFNFNGNKITEANVIFNFDNNNVTVVGEFGGNILYSKGTITLNGATVNGSLYSNTISSSSNTRINNSVISDVSLLPVYTLSAPFIEIDNYSIEGAAIVTISSSDPGNIYYKLNEGGYQLYSGEFTIDTIGSHVITAYISKYGYVTSPTSTGEVLLTCTCDNPIISFNEATNTVAFNTDTLNTTIYFTTNGTRPTLGSANVSNGGTYKLPYDGEYDIVAFADNGVCSPSGYSTRNVIASYPIETLTINVLSSSSGGFYLDEGGNGVRVQILKNTSSTSKIYYTEDGSDPMKSTTQYTGIFYTKSNIILAVIRDEYFGYSKIAKKDIIIAGPLYLEKSGSEENSLSKIDALASNPTYGLDIGWIGPSVIIDDTAIYQALVNILSTPIGSIPFNLTFGVSITNSIFELLNNFNSEQIISQLKSEIEYNDPRILVDAEDSYAYFLDESYQIVIDIAWVNRYTKEKAHVKYGYNLDGVL